MSAIELAVLRLTLPRLQEVRAASAESILTGKLADMREYGYACGYIKACDDLATILEQVITDIQGS